MFSCKWLLFRPWSLQLDVCCDKLSPTDSTFYKLLERTALEDGHIDNAAVHLYPYLNALRWDNV